MSETILIAVIDDDERLRAALIELLDSLGHPADGFASAEDFLAATGPRSYACIISDIQMPGMTGIELQQRLAADGSTVPVVMITGRPEPDLEQRVLAFGAVCLLKKPLEADLLVDSLQTALRM